MSLSLFDSASHPMRTSRTPPRVGGPPRNSNNGARITGSATAPPMSTDTVAATLSASTPSLDWTAVRSRMLSSATVPPFSALTVARTLSPSRHSSGVQTPSIVTTDMQAPSRVATDIQKPSIIATSSFQHVTFPDTMFLTLKQKRGKLRRKVLHFRAIHNNKGYWVGKTHHLYYSDSWFTKGFVISKLPPNSAKEPHIIATCNDVPPTLVPPAQGWQSDKYDEVSVSPTRPKDWIEGDIAEGRERVGKLLAAIKKTEKDGKFSLKIRDICRNIDVVKEILPELLSEFRRIDADGNGTVTLEELEHYFDPGKKRDHSKAKLDEFWEELLSKRVDDSKHIDAITLEDMGKNLEFIEDKLPELLESFQDIDVNKTCTIDRREFDAFFGSADIWLASKLQDIIGLGELKESIDQFYWQQKLDRMRRRGGAMVNNDEAIVIMFKGSPGTGKTTIGRLLTGLLYKIGVIETETFVECQRDELVGDHIGATEKLTSARIAEAAGGVLFVDEAYRLRSDIFGVEAINCLMRAMTVKGTVMILAGYPKQMDEFVSANPGLARRITYQMEFPDYSCNDLAQILKAQFEKRGFQLGEDATLEYISKQIEESTEPKQRTCFNGGIGEHISRHAIFSLNRREAEVVKKLEQTGGQEYTPSVTVTTSDISFGCTKIPLAPPDETLDFQKSKSSKVEVRIDQDM